MGLHDSHSREIRSICNSFFLDIKITGTEDVSIANWSFFVFFNRELVVDGLSFNSSFLSANLKSTMIFYYGSHVSVDCKMSSVKYSWTNDKA